MKRTKDYVNTFFPSEIIRKAYDKFKSKWAISSSKFEIKSIGSDWTFDNIEEFLEEYSVADEISIRISHFDEKESESRSLSITFEPRLSLTFVTFRSPHRQEIESFVRIFDEYASKAQIPPPPKPPPEPIKIFIGHGLNPQWRDLKDHLQEKHGYQVEAYETGPRAGFTVKEVLANMVSTNSIAFLVLTGEDEDKEGHLHPRDNVIHELGLFQGRLGFTRGIILLEEGTKEFSNIEGITQIRFSKGNIRETFGDVLATIRREFEE